MSLVKPGYELFTVTPFANTYLADFAIQALKSENLGKGKDTDAIKNQNLNKYYVLIPS